MQQLNEEVVNISNLRTDEGIADILHRLKSAKSSQVDNNPTTADKVTSDSVIEVPVEDVKVQNANAAVVISQDDSSQEVELSIDDDVLPWFNKTDLDSKYIHYIKFDQSGNILYDTVKASASAEELASLKTRADFVCDIDYYKSRHFVLCIKQIPSDYDYSRSFTTESVKTESLVDSTSTPVIEKSPTETLSDIVSSEDKYIHYAVFTDLGTIDFVVRSDEAPFPYGESNLSKWLEETSNYSHIIKARYNKNAVKDSDVASHIKNYKYDIITMHRPGIITLDSSDNLDPNYKVKIELKDEFSFIPMNRVLGCLKYYASHSNKSIEDLRRMLATYFDTFI